METEATKKSVSKVTRSTLGLRSVLFDELDHLRSGESAPQRANAISKVAAQIINTVNTELNFARFYYSRPPEERSRDSAVLQLG